MAGLYEGEKFKAITYKKGDWDGLVPLLQDIAAAIGVPVKTLSPGAPA